MSAASSVFTMISALLLTVVLAASASAAVERCHNIELILDASGSMRETAGERPKIDVARELLADLVDAIPDSASLKVGLRVYGNRSVKELKDCTDSHLELPVQALDRTAMKTVIAGLEPRGYTPLAYSLERSMEDFPAGINQLNVVILITDGVESCGGKPCDVAEQLKRSDKNVTVHVIGFQLGESNRETLHCIPRITGGFYYDALSKLDLQEALRKVLDASLHSGYLFIDTPGFVDHCKVFDQATGEFVKESYSRTEISLLPGRYRVEVPGNPPKVVDDVVIVKGEKQVLRPEGKGFLNVLTDSFIEGCKAYDPITGALVKEFYSRTQVQLPVGTYRIEIPTNPPEVQEDVVVRNGALTEVTLRAAGKLYIQSRGIISECRVMDPVTGTTVKTVYSRVPVSLPVGTYRVEIPGAAGETRQVMEDVVITAGKTTMVEVR
ncbi:VWA domain-containing protein [bacterium]|nr:VWA domain-containing protein [candidate division CSSED10-310 bacterium]